MSSEQSQFIPADVFDNIIKSFVDQGPKEKYLFSSLTRSSKDEYDRLSISEIGEWAGSQEPWILAVERDDDYLFKRLVLALNKQRVVLRYEDVDEDGRETNIVRRIVGLHDLESNVVTVADLLSKCIDNGSHRVFSILLNDPTFGDSMHDLLGYSNYHSGAIGLASFDSHDLSTVMDMYESNDIVHIINMAITTAGAHGLETALYVASQRQITLDSDYLDVVMDLGAEGLYGYQSDIILDLFSKYPYVHRDVDNGYEEDYDY